MARIRPIPRERAAVVLRSLYDHFQATYGAVPALFQAMAHRPELLLTFANFHRELWTGGGLDLQTKELAALRAAAVAGCRYSTAWQAASARHAGVSEAQVAAVQRDDWEASGLFDDRASAVLLLAEKLTRAPGSIADDDLERLRKWFGDAHLVELALLISGVNLTSRVAQCFALQPE